MHGLTYNVCKLLAETDPALFDLCNVETLKAEEKAEKEREEKKRFWMALKQQRLQVSTAPQTTTPASEESQ